MAKKSSVNIFDPSKSDLEIIFMLAWPVMLENLLSTLVSYADTAMVGGLGAYATAAVSLCNPAMFLITGAVLAMGTGVTALVARSIGAGDFATTKKLVRISLMMIIFMGIPLCVLYGFLHRLIPKWMGAGPDVLDYAADYNLIITLGRPFAMATMVLSSVFRGAGDTKTPMYVNFGVNIINIIGNYFLINATHTVVLFGAELTIWGAGWGVSGAAAASALSMIIGGIIMITRIFQHPGPTQVSIHDDFHIDWKLFRRVWDISLPALFERVSNLTGGIIISSSVAMLGTVAIAANTLHTTAEQLTQMPAFGMQMAATTMVGQYLGAKLPDRAERSVKSAVKYGAIVIAAASAALFFGARFVISFFTKDTQVIDIAVDCVRIMCFLQPVQMVAFVLAGGLRGAGDTKITMWIIAFSNWVVRILGTVLCIRVFHMGDENVKRGMFIIVAFMAADLIVRMFLFILRFRSGKWKTAIKDDASPAKS